MKKRWRTVQPPRQSERFTLEEAMEAWRKVEAQIAAEQAEKKSRRRSRSGARVAADAPADDHSDLGADLAERSDSLISIGIAIAGGTQPSHGSNGPACG
jgi:hypothetical protein